MTPKEKAQDLWLQYYELLPDGVYSDHAAKQEAKRFAIIAVDEILHSAPMNPYDGSYYEIWSDRKDAAKEY